MPPGPGEPFEGPDGQITEAFIKAYFAALASFDNSDAAAPQTPREKTFSWLVDQYCRSDVFKRYDRLTQADKRGVLNRFCETAGKLPYAAFRKERC